jgi:hypothetical protein
MLISLKGDNNFGVDPDALRHGVPPYKVHYSSAINELIAMLNT